MNQEKRTECPDLTRNGTICSAVGFPKYNSLSIFQNVAVITISDFLEKQGE